MKNGDYYARVTDDCVSTIFVDEDAVHDAQIHKIFTERGKVLAEQIHKQNLNKTTKRRKVRNIVRQCLWLTATASMVYFTCLFGVYAAIAFITGCVVAIGFRIAHLITSD